jgi:hypothetical protein
MALAGALCQTLLAATGITNKSLRALMTGLLHAPYSTGQMTYDLRRLRLAGLIRRIEHTNRYVLTPDGIKVAVFYTKLHNRLLRPLLAADQPQAPPELRAAPPVTVRSATRPERSTWASPYTTSRGSAGGRPGGTVSGKVRAAAGARVGRAAAEEGMTGAISVPVTAASRCGRRDQSAPWGGRRHQPGRPHVQAVL